MPAQLTIEDNQARRKIYRQRYYQERRDQYAASYQRKREETYLCGTCNKVLKLVSKAAHEKAQKHVYAYYRAGFNRNTTDNPDRGHGGT